MSNIYQARRVLSRARNTTQSKWSSFPNRNIFFDDRSRKAARIDSWANLHAHENGRNFAVSKKELKGFIGISFIMSIKKSPMIAEHCRADNLILNDIIHNTMFRNHFCEILQNRHFVDNRKEDKTDEAFKRRPVIDHLCSKFSEVQSNDSEQSIVEHMAKFKGRSEMKQHIKTRPIKWGFKFWFCSSSKSSYLYQMDIYLGRKQTPEFNLGLGEDVILHLKKDVRFALSILTTF